MSLQTLQISCRVDLHHSSQGKEGGLAPLLPFAGRGPREQSCDLAAVCSLWQHGTESWCPYLLFLAGFPPLKPRNSPALGYPHSSCDSGDPETMLSTWDSAPLHHLGIFKPVTPPTVADFESSDFAFCCLYYFVVASLSKLPPLHRIFPYVSPDSYLRTSYLPKSGRFSICRIATNLFSDFQLIS